MQRTLWAREELILTLNVYFQLPFGLLNRNTPEVKELARQLVVLTIQQLYVW